METMTMLETTYKTKEKKKEERVFTTKTTIKKWGNSQGIRISKEVMTKMNLKEEDTIEINIYNGKMVIEKIDKPKYSNLKERLEAFYKKPIDEIYIDGTQEVDIGTPQGEEIW